MADKSEAFVLDVLHKNETKSRDMLYLMRKVPHSIGALYSHVALTGDDHVKGYMESLHVLKFCTSVCNLACDYDTKF